MPRRLGAAAVGAACSAGVLAAGAGPAFAVQEPEAAGGRFGVLVEGDALLAGARVDGPVAVGGDLAFGTDQRVAVRTPGTVTASGDSSPTALLVGGGIDFAGSARHGVLRVMGDGRMKVGDLTGGAVREAGTGTAGGGGTHLVPAGAAYGVTPRVELTAAQPAASVAAARGLLDTGSVFAGHRERADALAACAGTMRPHDGRGAPLAEGAVPAPGSAVRLRPVPGRTNVVRLTGRQLASIGLLVFERRPTAAAPVVVVVDTRDTGGRLDWRTPALAGVGGQDAPYLLWSFPDATGLTLTAGGGSLVGAVHAPRARLTDLSPAALQGDVVVRELAAGRLAGPSTPGVDAGAYRSAPFTARLRCEPEKGTTEGRTPPGTGSETGTGTAVGAGTANGTGPETGAGTGTAPEPGKHPEPGANSGTGTAPAPGTDPAPGTGTGSGAVTDPSADAEQSEGAGPSADAEQSEGAGPSADAEQSEGSGPSEGGQGGGSAQEGGGAAPDAASGIEPDAALESLPEWQGMESAPEPGAPEESPGPDAAGPGEEAGAPKEPTGAIGPPAGRTDPPGGGAVASGGTGGSGRDAAKAGGGGPDGSMAETGARSSGLWMVGGVAAFLVSAGLALVTAVRRGRRGSGG